MNLLINNLKKNYYDLIILSHVFEHVVHPLDFIKLIKTKLKNEGIIFIDIPVEDWRYKKYFEPHLTFFNKKSITELSKKIDIEIISLDYIGHQIKYINLFFDNFFFKYIRIILCLFLSILNFNFSKHYLFNNFYNYYYKFNYKNKNISRWLRCILQK